MSRASRKLEVGAAVYTDFSGKITHHTITEVIVSKGCQSGVAFHVSPQVPKSTGGWIDADWFESATKTITGLGVPRC